MIEEILITFLGIFTLIFVFDYLLIKRRKLKKEKTISEIEYLKIKFKLEERKLDKSKVIIYISIINSFIIAGVSSVIILMKFDIMWKMMIAFVLLFGLIYSFYELLGRHLKRIETKD